MTSLPAAAITAAAEVLTNVILNGREATTGDELMDAAVAKLVLEAAAPHITAADPTTESEGFRAYQAGQAAGRAEGATAERERIYDLLGHDHYVIFTEDRWTIEHSVECRLSGRMHECDHHAAVARIAREFDPDMAGRWRIVEIDSEGLPDLLREDTP